MATLSKNASKSQVMQVMSETLEFCKKQWGRNISDEQMAKYMVSILKRKYPSETVTFNASEAGVSLRGFTFAPFVDHGLWRLADAYTEFMR